MAHDSRLLIRAATWASPFGALGLAAALALASPGFSMSTITLLTFVLAAVTLAHAWNLVGGYTGYIDLGQMLLVGVGAYTTGILLTRLPANVSFAQALVTTFLIGATLAGIISLIVMRLRGVQFALAMLAMFALWREIARSVNAFAPGGILFAPPYSTPWNIYTALLILCTLAFLVSICVVRSQFGLMLRAIRENEIGAETRGVNTAVIKLAAFTLAGGFTAAVGAARAYGQGVVVLDMAFQDELLAVVIAVTLLGGIGRPWGPVVGGTILYAALGAFPAPQAPYLLASAAILLAVFYLPTGILGWLGLDPENRGLPPQLPALPPLTTARIADLLHPPNGDGPPVLEVREVTRDFGGLRAVNKVSLQVRYGEIVGLLGPNGSGKTTLLNCINGILQPTGGEIFLNSQDITRLSPWRVNRYGLARTFERAHLFQGLTVHENMLLARRWRGLPLISWMWGAPEPIHRRADELLMLLGIDHTRDRLAHDLSTAQQRLLELGMALMSQPSLILLDEVTNGLPLEVTAELKSTIRRLNREFGLSFLIAEHQFSFAVDLCDRLYVLDHGSLVAEGTSRDIQHEPAVADIFTESLP